MSLLSCLIPQGKALLSPTSFGMPFSELMSILATLASSGSGVGHVQLFRAATEWLSMCRSVFKIENIGLSYTQGSTFRIGVHLGHAINEVLNWSFVNPKEKS